jgi:signal transduction histidine kinase
MTSSDQPPAHALIFCLDGNGILTMLHGPAAPMTGWQVGQSIHTVAADQPGLLSAVTAAMKGDISTANLRLGDSSHLLRLLPQPNGHPDSQGVLALTYDPGHSDLDRLTSRFISMITHRFRNPLTVINTTTFLLERYDAKLDADKKKEYFDKIRAQVGQLDEMIDQVLIVHGKHDHVFSPQRIDLAALAERVLDTVSPNATPAHIINLSTCGDLHLTGDPRLLSDLLRHLLMNAVKFSPAGGQINLRLWAEPTAIHIEVEDHGLGIPQVEQSRIGQPFFRASNATYMQGSGLGLRIATLYAEEHGGGLSFVSAEGQGSTFTVRLPVSTS